MSKRCSKCKENKELYNFHKHIKSKDGRHANCKECRRDNFKKI